jgi:hypothetical protein
MDLYFENSKRILIPEDLHLIGVTCIYIGSKFEEIIPFNMEII